MRDKSKIKHLLNVVLDIYDFMEHDRDTTLLVSLLDRYDQCGHDRECPQFREKFDETIEAFEALTELEHILGMIDKLIEEDEEEKKEEEK